MSERKKERSPTRRIGMRRNSSNRLAGMATKKETQRARAYSGPEMPVTIGTQLLGYLVFLVKSADFFEALTPERTSLGIFRDGMPAIHAIFEQLFPESKST
jgi:hypothetical protein